MSTSIFHLKAAVFQIIVILGLAIFSLPTSAQSGAVPYDLPDFTFYGLDDDKALTKKQLPLSDKIVLIFFDPSCRYCQEEAVIIGKNLALFKNTSFYFVSMQDKHLLKVFRDTHGKQLKGKQNVHFLHDTRFEFMGKFNPLEYPSMFVYSKEKKLLQYLHGNISLDRIKTALGVAL